MKFFVVLFALFAASQCRGSGLSPIVFEQFLNGTLKVFHQQAMRYGRHYSSEAEEHFRFGIFLRNMVAALEFQHTELGTAVYGTNQFFDWTDAEFKQYSAGLSGWSIDYSMKMAEIPRGVSKAPKSWDWREHGAVTHVKNQGKCGSCWTFATTGNIEGQWGIYKKQLPTLSEQELVDCDHWGVDSGCNGGNPAQAYKSIIKLGGLETEKDYPYKAVERECHFSSKLAHYYINGSTGFPRDEQALKAFLYNNGPLAIGVNAVAMEHYSGGIAHPSPASCDPKNLNHAVLIVGYGEEAGTPFWIIKNSWGEGWGEKGYWRVFRGAGVCGLNLRATSAIVR